MSASGPSDARIGSAFLRRPNFSTATPNERLVMHIIRREHTTTRAKISRETGLTPQSISRIVEGLVNRGLLQTGDRLRKGRGQPSVALQLVPDIAYSIGVSVMPDALSVVLINFPGDVVEQVTIVETFEDRNSTLARSKAIVDELIEKHVADRSHLFGLGLSIAGYFVGADSTVNPPLDLEDWALLDTQTLLSESFGLPVWVENDGNAAAIGESLLGAGLHSKSFAYLYFAAGFGGGIVMDGKPIRGFKGNAGEFGGLMSMLEFERPSLSLLREILAEDGIEFANVSELIDNYDPNWPAADRWIERVVPSLSVVVSAIAVTIDPELIILGGRIPKDLAERLIPELKIANSSRRGSPRPEPAIVLAETPGDAAAIGAAALPLKNHFFL